MHNDLCIVAQLTSWHFFFSYNKNNNNTYTHHEIVDCSNGYILLNTPVSFCCWTSAPTEHQRQDDHQHRDDTTKTIATSYRRSQRERRDSIEIVVAICFVCYTSMKYSNMSYDKLEG